MLMKIELKDTLGNFNSSSISVDLMSLNVNHFKNGVLHTESKLKVDRQVFKELLRKYVREWNNEYVENTSLPSSESDLTIYTDTGVISYCFKNDYPNNYNAFIEEFKTMIEI